MKHHLEQARPSFEREILKVILSGVNPHSDASRVRFSQTEFLHDAPSRDIILFRKEDFQDH